MAIRPIALLLLFSLLVLSRRAAAQELTPELSIASLRTEASSELRGLVATLPEPDRKSTVGLYVAFDANPSDVSALLACDDDGDPAIVVTDALLKLLEYSARAAAVDETYATHKVKEYATLLADSQRVGMRLLPPPPGFFEPTHARSAAVANLQIQRFREALAGVVARELAHLIAGDLVCSSPTATRERGDDVWTAEEQRLALATSPRVYAATSRAAARDRTATQMLVRSERTEAGLLAFLRVLAEIDKAPSSHFSTYAALHPASSARAATVRAAVLDESASPAAADR